MTITNDNCEEKKHVSQSGNTYQDYCFFYHQDPQAEHQKMWTLVTSASSVLLSSSEQFSIGDKTGKAIRGRYFFYVLLQQVFKRLK